MTPLREVVALPVVFLPAVARRPRVADTITLTPPSPYMLILGLLLVRLVVQSGALAPQRLLSRRGHPLANLNGARRDRDAVGRRGSDPGRVDA